VKYCLFKVLELNTRRECLVLSELISRKDGNGEFARNKKMPFVLWLFPMRWILALIAPASRSKSTISNGKSKNITGLFAKINKAIVGYKYDEVPKEDYTQLLNRPKVLTVDGKKYYPNLENIYGAGHVDFYTVHDSKGISEGTIQRKQGGRYIAMDLKEYPLTPDQLDQSPWSMNDQGVVVDNKGNILYGIIIDDGQEKSVPVTYSTKNVSIELPADLKGTIARSRIFSEQVSMRSIKKI